MWLCKNYINKIVSINKKRILQTVKMRSGKILFFRLVVIRLRDGR